MLSEKSIVITANTEKINGIWQFFHQSCHVKCKFVIKQGTISFNKGWWSIFILFWLYQKEVEEESTKTFYLTGRHSYFDSSKMKIFVSLIWYFKISLALLIFLVWRYFSIGIYTVSWSCFWYIHSLLKNSVHHVLIFRTWNENQIFKLILKQPLHYIVFWLMQAN